MDQVRPQVRSWLKTTRTLDWPTYPLEPHEVAATAPTTDRSKIPAEGYPRKWKEGLTNQRPLQKPNLRICRERIGRICSLEAYAIGLRH